MPRKAKNKTIRKAAKQAKEFSDPVNAGEEFSIDAKQSEGSTPEKIANTFA